MKIVTLIALALMMTACSEVSFDKQSGGSSGTLGNPDGTKSGDDAGGTINADGGSDPTGGTTPTTPGGGGTPGGSTTPTTPGGGTTPTTPGGSTIVMPRVRFIGPPCVRGSNCVVQFQLDKSYSAAIDFDWRTDDTLYLTTAPAGVARYAQPNVHYVPASGHIVFMPGETLKTVYVQNINPYNYEVTIGVRMRNCMYGGRLDTCAEYFR